MAEAAAKRHALGLPEGSIRAVLAVMVVGLTCLLVLVPTPTKPMVPPFLILLVFLIVGHTFAGHSLGSFPLYIPVNLLRLLLLGGLIAAFTMKVVTDPDGFQTMMNNSLEDAKQHPYVLLFLLGGFAVGLVFRMIVG